MRAIPTSATRLPTAQEEREKLIEVLNQQLADTLDLRSQAKQAYWNAKGLPFFQLHESFDLLAGALEKYSDLIAARVTTLGGTAMGTVLVTAATSRLRKYPLDAVHRMQHVEALAEGVAYYATTIRMAINAGNECHDASTAELFTEISCRIDKHLWLLETHLQRHHCVSPD